VRGSVSIVRLFEWPYNAIGAECRRLGQRGWTAVEVSPPASHHVSSDSQLVFPRHSWPSRLFPSDPSNLTSSLGTEDELVAAISECHRERVQVYAAVALNQVVPGAAAAVHQPCSTTNYSDACAIQCRDPKAPLSRRQTLIMHHPPLPLPYH
jgi:hypothetical protein